MSVSLTTNTQIFPSLPNVNITSQPVGSSGSRRKDDVGPIVGGVLGGLAFFLLVAAAAFIFWRKRKRQQLAAITVIDEEQYKPDPFSVAEYNNVSRGVAQMPYSIIVGGQRAPDGAGFFQPQSPSDVGTSSTSLSAGAAAVPTPAMSRKQREALGWSRGHVSMQSESALSSFSSPHSASASGTEDLRAEVEQLRREMESIRNIADAPPGYA